MLPHTIKSDAQTIEELLSMGCTSSKAIPNEVQVIDKVVNALEKDKEEKYVKVNVDVEVETSDDQPNNHINKSTNTFDSAEYEYTEDVIAKKKAKDTMNQKPAAVSSNTNTKEKKRQLYHIADIRKTFNSIEETVISYDEYQEDFQFYHRCCWPVQTNDNEVSSEVVETLSTLSINEAELVVEPSDSDDLTTDEEDDESAKHYQLPSQCAERAALQEETQELDGDDLTTDEGEDELAIQYQPLSQCQRELDVKEQWKLQGPGVVALMGVSPEEITMVNSIRTMPAYSKFP